MQAEAENDQLRAKLKQLSTVQDQNKLCIDQLLSRLQDAQARLQESQARLRESEAVRRADRNTSEALRQQVDAYREDFEGERLDRHRAQERVVNLERQLAALKHQVRCTCCELRRRQGQTQNYKTITIFVICLEQFHKKRNIAQSRHRMSDCD